MPNSLRVKLSKLRYKGKITQEEYTELIKKLDGHDSELLDKVMQKHRIIIDDDGVMYKVVFSKILRI